MRWALCNEILEDRPLEEAFGFIANVGYEALELAPYTLGPNAPWLEEADRQRVRSAADAAGLAVTGMHWLLARTEGLHVAASDPDQRAATLAHLRGLTMLCADLGGRVMVFGSPDQRSTPAGMSPADARARAVELFGEWATTAETAGVTICLEALPRAETDFMTTTAEVIGIVEELGSPAVRLVLDVKSMADEGRPIPDLVRLAAPYVAHFQANDANRGGPGFGDTDFVPIFGALAEIGYAGDVSVEAFDLSSGPEDVAVRSLDYLRTSASLAGFTT
jgi:D-psicose/D-tagatose/L-ribulose 3-epimerase